MYLNNHNTKNAVAKKIIYNVMLLTMLHSSFVAPAQNMLQAYFNKKEGLHYKGFREFQKENTPVLAEQGDTDRAHEGEGRSEVEKNPAIKKLPLVANNLNVMMADIGHGYIGITKTNLLDDVKDNIFTVMVSQLPNEHTKVFLTYELYGVSDYLGVSRSINDRMATGGHIIKKQSHWTLQREEIDPSWLNVGENKIMFSIPAGAMLQYQVKNLKIEFDKNENKSVLPLLVTSNSNIYYVKDNKLYVKGFLRNLVSKDASVFIENSKITLHDGEFEGFLELTNDLKQRKFAILKAVDSNGLLGQEVLNLDTLKDGDALYSFERFSETATLLLDVKKGGFLKTDGASITIKDSALVANKELQLTHLRRVDVAPMASGMINVTKGGSAYRFLPDGIKFNKRVSISIAYDEKLIPNGYTSKDIKTFYFNTNSKSWIAVVKDSVNEKDKTIVSHTDHFTDYINGIIQSPESPETAGFTPTMMNGIQAADPSAEITLISPPSVSQTGEANISYPIKIPTGRNGMQPNVNLTYNSDSGSGWLGQGWSINVPFISIDTKWGSPAIDNINETVIYTLGGEQLMYPKFKNADNIFVDWMPNRQYDSTATAISTAPRPKIDAVDAKFTPRKQGSYAKIERLGSSPSTYYWKVTNTDGTISWYGGKTGVIDNAVLKNSFNQIVYWSLYMTEDIHTNNIKYTYSKTVTASNLTGDKASLSSGTIYNIDKINYTGFDNTTGLYEIYFKRSPFTILRTDATINARLGIKMIDPCKLEEIIIRRTGSSSMIRKYTFSLKQGEFQKTLLDNVAEFTSNDTEFYRHTFDYYNDVRKSAGDDLVLFDRAYQVKLPNFNLSPDYSLGIGNLLDHSKLNTVESIEPGWGVNLSAGLEFRFWKHSNDPYATVTVNSPFGESYPRDKGIMTMADIDGDGLEDVVYKSNNGLKYYIGGIDEDGKVFYDTIAKNIEGITNFSRSTGRTKTMFLESHNLKVKVPFTSKRFFLGKTRTKSNINTDIFFTDGNGDGLIDIVKDNIVLFNQTATSSGGRHFGNSSQPSPNMLITANTKVLPGIDYVDDDGIVDAQGYDAVRVWIAPKSGLIKIEDVVQLNTTVPNKSAYYSI